jgi:2-iminobutanoate/2-iminopropanoate deaminase
VEVAGVSLQLWVGGRSAHHAIYQQEEIILPTGFEVDEVWTPRGRGFQMGVVQGDGVVVHLTGQVAWSADEKIVGKEDVRAQTRQIFANIQKLLAKVGGNLSDIVSVTTYFTDRTQLPSIQEIRSEYLPAGREPASTSVMVAGLGHEDFLVEMTPVAVIPMERYIAP